MRVGELAVNWVNKMKPEVAQYKSQPLVQTLDRGKKTVSVLAHLFLQPQRPNSGCRLHFLPYLRSALGR